MLTRLLCVAALAAFLQACPPESLPRTEVQGTWTGKVYVSGEPLFVEPDYSETFMFTDTEFLVTVRNPGQSAAVISGTYTLNAERDTIDMLIESSPGGESGLSLGVYAVEDNTLYIAFGGIGGARPAAGVLDPAVGPVFIGAASPEKSTLDAWNGGGLY